MTSQQYSVTQHPLDAIKQAIRGDASDSGTGGAEQRAPRKTHFQGANEGPADVIAKVSGHVSGGIRNDDAPYFTNHEGIPWPDGQVHSKPGGDCTKILMLDVNRSHSKTIGGIPVASDVFLFQYVQILIVSTIAPRMSKTNQEAADF